MKKAGGIRSPQKAIGLDIRCSSISTRAKVYHPRFVFAADFVRVDLRWQRPSALIFVSHGEV
jgi:hypothetical protein